MEDIINAPLIKAILLFYLLTGSGYVKELYSGQMKDFLENNRYAQHFIGFTMMMIIMGYFMKIKDPKKIMMYSTFAYGWFILSTKLDLQWNIAIILLMIIGYLYYSDLEDKEKNLKNNNDLREDLEQVKKKNDYIRKVMMASIFVITVVGMAFYGGKKITQYGGNFDIETFFLADRIKN